MAESHIALSVPYLAGVGLQPKSGIWKMRLRLLSVPYLAGVGLQRWACRGRGPRWPSFSSLSSGSRSATHRPRPRGACRGRTFSSLSSGSRSATAGSSAARRRHRKLSVPYLAGVGLQQCHPRNGRVPYCTFSSLSSGSRSATEVGYLEDAITSPFSSLSSGSRSATMGLSRPWSSMAFFQFPI